MALIAIDQRGLLIADWKTKMSADINARSTLGWTALMAARRNRHEQVMVLLEDHSKKLEANK